MVTGKGAASAAITLHRLGLAPYFDKVETGSPDGAIKPVGIRNVLAHWRIAAHEAAYVGDAPYDMRASAEVGVLPLGAAWADTATVTLNSDPPPAVLFTSVAQFVQWLAASHPIRNERYMILSSHSTSATCVKGGAAKFDTPLRHGSALLWMLAEEGAPA